MKVKATISEWNTFYHYLQDCILGDAKTNDNVKEYYLANSADQLAMRIHLKLAGISIMKKPVHGPFPIKVEKCEVLALSIYFNRYPVHPFIQFLEKDILNQMPGEIIKVLKPVNDEKILEIN